MQFEIEEKLNTTYELAEEGRLCAENVQMTVKKDVVSTLLPMYSLKEHRRLTKSFCNAICLLYTILSTLLHLECL